MSTGAIVAVAVGAVVLVAIVVVLARMARTRRLDTRRDHADELRDDARARWLRSESERAAADQQAARAKKAEAAAEELGAAARRESAAAQERSQRADRERKFARERQEEARSIDPDVDDRDTGGRQPETSGVGRSGTPSDRPDPEDRRS